MKSVCAMFELAAMFIIAALVVSALGGCAMSVGVGKIDLGVQVDPGKLAPLVK